MATIQNIFKLLLKSKDIIIRPTNIHSKDNLYRVAYKNKMFHIDTVNEKYHTSLPIKRTDEFISWCKSNIRSSRYIVHTMLQPPNQLTYPLHIRTILQKQRTNLECYRSIYTKVHFLINFYPQQQTMIHCIHFQKLNTYYLVQVCNYCKTLYTTL